MIEKSMLFFYSNQKYIQGPKEIQITDRLIFINGNILKSEFFAVLKDVEPKKAVSV